MTTQPDPLAAVPAKMRSIVRLYLRSLQPQDEARGRELADKYGLNYDAIRAAWGLVWVERVRFDQMKEI